MSLTSMLYLSYGVSFSNSRGKPTGKEAPNSSPECQAFDMHPDDTDLDGGSGSLKYYTVQGYIPAVIFDQQEVQDSSPLATLLSLRRRVRRTSAGLALQPSRVVPILTPKKE